MNGILLIPQLPAVHAAAHPLAQHALLQVGGLWRGPQVDFAVIINIVVVVQSGTTLFFSWILKVSGNME